MMMKKGVFVACALACSWALPASAGTVSIDAGSRGCLAASGEVVCGSTFTDVGNFFAGERSNLNPEELRSFLLFDLAGITGPVTGAVLEIEMSTLAVGVRDADPFETVGLFDVGAASLAALSGGSGGMAVFDDMGSGVTYQTRNFTDADEGTTVSIVLNGLVIDALNASLGGDFGFGLAVLTLDNTLREGVFGDSTFRRVSLILETNPVPLPAAALLFPAGFVALARARKRKAAAIR
jgi:hypothetical protein